MSQSKRILDTFTTVGRLGTTITRTAIDAISPSPSRSSVSLVSRLIDHKNELERHINSLVDLHKADEDA